MITSFLDLFRIIFFLFFFIWFFCFADNEKRYIDLIFSDEAECIRDIAHNNIVVSLSEDRLAYVDSCDRVVTVNLDSLEVIKSSYLKNIVGYEPSGTVDIFFGKNIFIIDRDVIYSLDSDYRVRWKYTNDMPIVYVQQYDNNIIVRFSDLSFDILDVFTGSVMWSVSGALPSITPVMWMKSSLYHIPIWNNRIFFDLNDDSLISYFANDYSTYIWSKQIGEMRSFHMSSGFLYGPKILDDVLFTVTRSKEIVSLDPVNGDIFWSRFIHDFYPDSNLFLLDHHVCYVASRKKIQCFDKRNGNADFSINIQNSLLTSSKSTFWTYTERFGANFCIIVSPYGSAHIFSKHLDKYYDAHVAQLGGPINKVLFVKDKIITLLFDSSVRVFTW